MVGMGRYGQFDKVYFKHTFCHYYWISLHILMILHMVLGSNKTNNLALLMMFCYVVQWVIITCFRFSGIPELYWYVVLQCKINNEHTFATTRDLYHGKACIAAIFCESLALKQVCAHSWILVCLDEIRIFQKIENKSYFYHGISILII